MRAAFDTRTYRRSVVVAVLAALVLSTAVAASSSGEVHMRSGVIDGSRAGKDVATAAPGGPGRWVVRFQKATPYSMNAGSDGVFTQNSEESRQGGYMKQSSVEFGVGVFVLLGIICIGYLTICLGEVEVLRDNYYFLNARFTSVTGLKWAHRWKLPVSKWARWIQFRWITKS